MTSLYRIIVRAAVVLLILVASFHATTSPAAVTLTDSSLGMRGAISFWKDPCTWDGVTAGVGAVFCASGNLAGCATAVYSVWKAIKLDDCF